MSPTCAGRTWWEAWGLTSWRSPVCPEAMDWSSHFPAFVRKDEAEEGEEGEGVARGRSGQLVKNIEVADVGCGFGGLLFALAPRMADTLILGTCLRRGFAEAHAVMLM